MKKLRLLLADDHKIVIEGLRRLLEPEFDIVGVVGDGRALVAQAKALRPDVIVADIAMPLLNGIEALLQLKETGVESKVVVLTMHNDATYAARAFDAGASGFVLKQSDPAELVTAIREVWLGRNYVTPLITKELIEKLRDGGSRPDAPPCELTPRQREVLQLTAEGRSMKEVAAILKISPRTAEFHKASVMTMLGLHTTAELVQYAIRHRIVSS